MVLEVDFDEAGQMKSSKKSMTIDDDCFSVSLLIVSKYDPVAGVERGLHWIFDHDKFEFPAILGPK